MFGLPLLTSLSKRKTKQGLIEKKCRSQQKLWLYPGIYLWNNVGHLPRTNSLHFFGEGGSAKDRPTRRAPGRPDDRATRTLLLVLLGCVLLLGRLLLLGSLLLVVLGRLQLLLLGYCWARGDLDRNILSTWLAATWIETFFQPFGGVVATKNCHW